MQLGYYQQKVKEMYKKNGWNTDSSLLLLAMQEELGEVCARFLAEHPGYKKSDSGTDPIPEEIGDLLTLILAFCNKEGINAEEWLENTINKRKNQG